MIDKEIINKILENEFHHIQEYRETDDLKENKEYQEDQEKAFVLYEQLTKGLYKDQRSLLLEYEGATTDWAVDLARYYFRKGVEVGVTNLDFMKDYKEVL